MALLSVTPLVYVHGVDGTVWKRVWAFQRPADAVWGGALGVCVGAWLGAVPIPLDWYVPLFFQKVVSSSANELHIGTGRGRHSPLQC